MSNDLSQSVISKETFRRETNLPVARQTIDTVEMLQNKTQGNLSEEEANLIKNLLTELRMHYLEAVK